MFGSCKLRELKSEMKLWWGLVKVEAQSTLSRGSHITTSHTSLRTNQPQPKHLDTPEIGSTHPGIAIDHGL